MTVWKWTHDVEGSIGSMGEFLGGQIWLSPGKEPLTAGAAQQQRQGVPGTGHGQWRPVAQSAGKVS